MECKSPWYSPLRIKGLLSLEVEIEEEEEDGDDEEGVEEETTAAVS